MYSILIRRHSFLNWAIECKKNIDWDWERESLLNTVKSLLVAAATNFFRWSKVRLLIKGGLYLRAASIANFPKNYVKLG